MARKQKKRGSGGHPARVAAQRQQAREASEGGLAATARRLAAHVSTLDSAGAAERWAAALLGRFWASLQGLRPEEAIEIDDPAMAFGAPLLQRLARQREAGAAVALAAVAAVDDGELGLLADQLLEEHTLAGLLPAWAAQIGAVEVVAATLLRDPVFDDGQIVALEARRNDGASEAVGVYIDTNLGCLVTAVFLDSSLEALRENLIVDDDARPLLAEELAPGMAAARIITAIGVTDATHQPPVSEAYWEGRALALLFADQTDGLVFSDEPEPELTTAAQVALVEAFLAAPEGAGVGSEAERRVLMLAVDYAGGFAGEDPLRWSPVSVDIFMLDWVAEDEATTDAEIAVMPQVMDAWVQFAGRLRGTPADAVALTRAAIAEVAAELPAIRER